MPWERTWKRMRSIAGAALAAALVSALLVPGLAVALDSDLKGGAVFKLKGSNGYSILGFAASERADGRGDIGLIVYRKGAAATYATRATITPTRLEADLGELGRIAVDIVATGTERTLRSRCGGDSQTVEPDVYRGTFEFRGEGGYTEAVATSVPEYPRFLLDLGCGGSGSEGSGPGRTGAWLRAQQGKGHDRIGLEVKKERFGGPSRFSAEITEKRDRITIKREVVARAASAAFDYDPLLRTAAIEPPPPFSGRATFHRTTFPAGRLSGSLAVDFPGRPGALLTGSAFDANLVPARRGAGF